jgi:serine/threonine protein kinase
MTTEQTQILNPGYKLHWYKIIKVLGQGGFGITYLAEDENLQESVAIKEYFPIQFASRNSANDVKPLSETNKQEYEWGLGRFIDEARTLTRFRHPAITRVRSVFEENNSAYMVMDYEEGDSLAQLLKNKKTLSEELIRKFLIPLIDGLKEVHKVDFIHRDIKPANIIIKKDRAVLIDFGSARQTTAGDVKTLTQLVSPGYAPYEQYHSDSTGQGPWTDIYSLAATMYRASTGITPPQAIDRSHAVLETNRDVYVSASELCANKYSASFLNAIDYALAFRASERPQSMDDWQKHFQLTENAKNSNEEFIESVTVMPEQSKIEEQQGEPETSSDTSWAIGVLPFRNLSTDPDQTLFAEAITEDIISGLTQSMKIRVLPSAALSEISSVETNTIKASRENGVNFLLQGSIRKSGNQLRVTVQLNDTEKAMQLWSNNYDKKLTADNLFDVQDDIRAQIVATLSDYHGVIYSKNTAINIRRPTASLSAYECMSVALAYDKQMSEENHLRARESLERAVQIDSDYAEAWAHLSWIYTDEELFGYNLLPDAKNRAFDAARLAVELAPTHHHVRWLMSRVYYFNNQLDLFFRETEESLRLNTNDGTTLGLIGMYVAFAGDWQRGLSLLDKAKSLNPNFPSYYYMVEGIAEFVKKNYAGALPCMQKFHNSGVLISQICLASVYVRNDNVCEAKKCVDELKEEKPEFSLEIANDHISLFFLYQPELVETITNDLQTAGLT